MFINYCWIPFYKTNQESQPREKICNITKRKKTKFFDCHHQAKGEISRIIFQKKPHQKPDSGPKISKNLFFSRKFSKFLENREIFSKNVEKYRKIVKKISKIHLKISFLASKVLVNILKKCDLGAPRAISNKKLCILAPQGRAKQTLARIMFTP